MYSLILNRVADIKQVLAIRNISFETLGRYTKFLKNDGYKIKDFMAYSKKFSIENPSDYDAIFILGGPMSAYDNLDYLVHEKFFIKTAIEKDVPVMGICLGAQLVASTVGGKVFRGTKKEIGWDEVTLTSQGKKSLFNGILERKIKVFHWHGDTFSLPKEADILSVSDDYIQSFRYKSAFGIQFHLEVTDQMIKKWANKYNKELESEKINKMNLVHDINNNLRQLENTSKIVYENFKSLM